MSTQQQTDPTQQQQTQQPDPAQQQQTGSTQQQTQQPDPAQQQTQQPDPAQDKYKKLLNDVTGANDGGQNTGGAFEKTINQLKEQLEQYKYPNEFVKELAKRFNKNEPLDDIRLFVESHFTDFKRLTDEEKVKIGLRRDYPSLTTEEVNAIFDAQYPDTEDQQTLRIAKIKLAATEAEKKLTEGRVSLDKIEELGPDPEHQESLRRAQRMKEAWGSVAKNSMGTIPPRFSFNTKSEAIGGEYSFEYDFQGVDTDAIVPLLTDYAVAAGLPLDETGMEKLMEYRNNVFLLMHQREIFEAMVTDFYAQITDYYSKKYSGMLPNNSMPPVKKPGLGKPTPGMV